jgi:transposase
LTQEEAARLLGVCDRTFRRQIRRYEAEGMDGLVDKRLSPVSHLRAPVDEVMALTERSRERFFGWNIKHFYTWHCREGGARSYSWVKNTLQVQGLVKKAASKGKHRKRRERAALPGMMLHQDPSTHEWVPGRYWDLVVTMDDATSEHYSMRFVEEEGTRSSFLGVRDVIEKRGLFCSFYTDRGSHYWHTPEAGGKVDKDNPTQFGRAMRRLGIEMIAAYSPEARGRSERAFQTHQGRLPRELALNGITDREEANHYLTESYLPAFNEGFMQKAREEGDAFVPCLGVDLQDVLCEQFERPVGKDNCVQFEGLALQLAPDQKRMNYAHAKVRMHRHLNGNLAVFHGPRRLGLYDKAGQVVHESMSRAAWIALGR